MKKLLALLLILTLVNGCLGFTLAEETAPAPEPEKHTSGDYEYIILEDGTAEISGYSGTAEELTIPDELDGIRVTGIGGGAFFDCESLTSVTIPDSVTSIGDGAFDNCDFLTSVTIPDSVTSIGIFAFSLCTSLTSVTIPDGVTSIGDGAFSKCSSLTSITIPDSVISIGTNPFVYCNKLTDIIVSVDHPYLATIDGVLLSKPDKRLVCYPYAFTADSYVIQDGIQIIGDQAFVGCISLRSVKVPDSLTSIGDYAFSGCQSLTSVTIPDSVTSIGANPFVDCGKLTDIVVSADHPYLATIDGVLFSKPENRLVSYPCTSTIDSYNVPNGIQIIGDDAFLGCDSLTSVTIPDSVTVIGDWAFFDCISLTSVTIPDSVTSIGVWAFFGSDKLTVTVSRDSYAAQYCEDNGINYTYPDAND